MIYEQLQQCLNKLQKWTTANGFKFSISKTQYVYFCQLGKLHNDPALYLNNFQIPVVEEA